MAVYNGDGNNNFFVTPTSGPGTETQTVNPANPSIGTAAGGLVTLSSGNKLTDSATLSSAYNPGSIPNSPGTITFYLFSPGVSPNDPANPTNYVYLDTVTATGNGPFSTATGTNPGGYVPMSAGTYQWYVVYSGDGNNNGANNTFGGEPETVTA